MHDRQNYQHPIIMNTNNAQKNSPVCISTPAHRDVWGDDGSRLLHGEDVRSHVVGVVHNGRGGDG